MQRVPGFNGQTLPLLKSSGKILRHFEFLHLNVLKEYRHGINKKSIV